VPRWVYGVFADPARLDRIIYPIMALRVRGSAEGLIGMFLEIAKARQGDRTRVKGTGGEQVFAKIESVCYNPSH